MPARITITADDAAILPAIDDAIIDLLARGIITHVAAFPNGSRFSALSHQVPQPSVLLPHITLTYGMPLSDPEQLPLLLNELGQFRQPLEFYWGNIELAISEWFDTCLARCDAEAVARELQRQCLHFQAITGCPPGPVTFHHDIDEVASRLDKHGRASAIFTAGRTAEVGGDRSGGYLYRFLPAGITQTCANELVAKLLNDAITLSTRQSGRSVEAIFHPASGTSLLAGFTSYALQRVQEYHALISSDVEEVLQQGRKVDGHYEFA